MTSSRRLASPQSIQLHFISYVLVSVDEEEKDYVARIHFLRNTTPQEAEEEASRDIDFESLLSSSLGSKEGKKQIAASETSSGTNPKPLKRAKMTTTNKKCAITQIVIKPDHPQIISPVPATSSTDEQRIKQLKFELRTTIEQREVFVRQWNDYRTEVTRLMKEAEKQKKSHKTNLEGAQKEAKDLHEAHQKISKELDEANQKLNEANKKLEGVEQNAIARVNSMAKRSIYDAWMANPNMDLSFLGEGVMEMLAFF
uniref:Uncharacterized protein n=1 Tax=Cannabis sativa TaxID=3483 RepID=A0A803PH20_CANSA